MEDVNAESMERSSRRFGVGKYSTFAQEDNSPELYGFVDSMSSPKTRGIVRTLMESIAPNEVPFYDDSIRGILLGFQDAAQAAGHAHNAAYIAVALDYLKQAEPEQQPRT